MPRTSNPPGYKLTFEDGSEALMHHGIKGMKWGVWNAETRARRMGFRQRKASNPERAESRKRIAKALAVSGGIVATVALVRIGARAVGSVIGGPVGGQVASTTAAGLAKLSTQALADHYGLPSVVNHVPTSSEISNGMSALSDMFEIPHTGHGSSAQGHIDTTNLTQVDRRR